MSDTRIRLGHAAIITPDLDRLRRFYEHTLRLEVVAEDVPPDAAFTRLAAFSDGRSVALLVFEQPDVELVIGQPFGGRGPIDHLAFVVEDPVAFDAAARRLVDAGASSGEVRPLGPTLSLHFVDPDGRPLNLQRPNPDWDPATIGADPGLHALIAG